MLTPITSIKRRNRKEIKNRKKSQKCTCYMGTTVTCKFVMVLQFCILILIHFNSIWMILKLLNINFNSTVDLKIFFSDIYGLYTFYYIDMAYLHLNSKVVLLFFQELFNFVIVLIYEYMLTLHYKSKFMTLYRHYSTSIEIVFPLYTFLNK